VFAADPDVIWQAVLSRQQGTVSMLVNHPTHPSMNCKPGRKARDA
jgi:hypothetical protein